MSRNSVSKVRLETNRKNQAFTISELLVSTVIFGILMGVTNMSLSGVFQNYEENTQTAQIDQSARSIMERMMREIRSAADVECHYNELEIVPNSSQGNIEKIKYTLLDSDFYYRTRTDGDVFTTMLLGNNDNVTVQSFTTTIAMGSDEMGEFVSMVTVSLELKTKDKTQTITASACPRISRYQSTQNIEEKPWWIWW